MSAIVWLHGDSLSPADPALLANPAAPAIFVFDEPFLTAAQLSFKRLLFLYESAVEALEGRAATMRRGVVVPEVLAFLDACGAREIHVTSSIAPRFRTYLAELRQRATVVVHEPRPFVEWHGEPPRRFSAFWRRAEPSAFRPTGLGPVELGGQE